MNLTRVSNFAFGLALLLYVVAMAAYFHHLAFRRSRVRIAAVALTYAGVLAHLASVITRGFAAGRVPWGNMYEYSSIVGLLVVAGYLVVERVSKVRSLGGFALGAAVLAMAGATMVYVTPGPLVPALNSYWIRIHVVAAMTGSSLFILGFVFTLLYLVRDRKERREAARAVAEPAPALAAVGGGGLPHDLAASPDEPEPRPDPEPRPGWLPAAAVLDRLAYRTIAFGFPIWTFAVIAGAIWAEQAWGRYWGWDPKEVWSFITWVVFAAYLHARATVGWRGRRAAVIAVVGFAALAFNLYAVNLVIPGLHSYAK
ncbi:MAG TPA: c-type cytochrome biogenesis protein CcsB [Actinomycetota bacterium]|nr:c-type cytochrome biogenesis protein CcsB [Actinomycetota bacterium]